MRRLLRVSQIIDRVSIAIGHAAAWLVLAMVGLGAFNAVARYLGRSLGVQLGSNAWVELQWVLFSAVFLLGGAWVLATDAHVRVDVLYGRLAPRRRAWIDLVGTITFLLPFAAFGFVSSLPTVRASWAVWEMSPDAGGLPRYPIKTLIPLGFALLFVQGLSELIKKIAAVRAPLHTPPEEAA